MRGYKNFEGNPHPGDLKHMIEIGYTVNEVNANGYPEPRDVVLCRVWASATDAGNQHYRSADVMNTEAVVNFTISWRSLEDRNDMKLTKEQFEREGDYRLAVAIMRTLRGKGLLTEVEYCKANERLVDRYNPVWGHLPDVVA